MMPLAMANVGDVNIIRKITGRDEVRAAPGRSWDSWWGRRLWWSANWGAT